MEQFNPGQLAAQNLQFTLDQAIDPDHLLEENEQEEAIIRRCLQFYKPYELEKVVQSTIADGALGSLAYLTETMQRRGTYPHYKMNPVKYGALTSYIGNYVLNTAASIASQFLNPALSSLPLLLSPDDYKKVVTGFAAFIATRPPSFILDATAQGFVTVMSTLNTIKSTSPSYYQRQLEYHLNNLGKY